MLITFEKVSKCILSIGSFCKLHTSFVDIFSAIGATVFLVIICLQFYMMCRKRKKVRRNTSERTRELLKTSSSKDFR
jgi:hypothetical protein